MADHFLTPGVPTIEAYQRLRDSEVTQRMEDFSDGFLVHHHDHLSEYSKRWVQDPYHQWSRLWEYPFVFSNIRSYLAGKAVPQANILDAGSGITFFPYFIQANYPNAEVNCCDFDESLQKIYTLINETTDKPVHFSLASLDRTPYPPACFDVVYCISVLEHTRNFDQILAELFRILVPGGRLLVTFDISLDGKGDINIGEVGRLLHSMERYFSLGEIGKAEISEVISRSDILTTEYVLGTNPDLLPWKPPTLSMQLKSILKRNGWIRYPAPYTICCLSMAKNGPG
jgi:SAM-dependent methyltransferase